VSCLIVKKLFWAGVDSNFAGKHTGSILFVFQQGTWLATFWGDAQLCRLQAQTSRDNTHIVSKLNQEALFPGEIKLRVFQRNNHSAT
jgi:hypothetical protein